MRHSWNEDILLNNNGDCYTKLKNLNLNQVVNTSTCDSGTLIDHMYISSHLTCESAVANCYFSDHDFIFGVIQQLKHYISCTLQTTDFKYCLLMSCDFEHNMTKNKNYYTFPMYYFLFHLFVSLLFNPCYIFVHYTTCNTL